MKTVFFDRDGIVNIPPPEGGYILTPEEFKIEPLFPAVLRAVTELGYAAVVVTNQRCIAQGMVTQKTVNDIHEYMRNRLRKEHGLALLDVLLCPHGPEDGCKCRKPLPGMLLEAARRHNLDLSSSWMIGDRMTDIEAGRRAGCRTILVNAAPDAGAGRYRPDHACPAMASLLSGIHVWLR